MFQPGSVKSGGHGRCCSARSPGEDLFSLAAAAPSRKSPSAATAPEWRADRTGALELGGDQVGGVPHVPEPRASGNGELHRVIQARIEKRSAAAHLEIGEERIPMRDTSPSRSRCADHRHPKAGGIRVAADLPVRPERLAVQQQAGVELARSPAPQNALRCSATLPVDPPRLSRSANGCSSARDAISPTSRSRLAHPSSRWPIPDASESFHRGVAKGALDTDRFQTSAAVEKTCQTHHGVQLSGARAWSPDRRGQPGLSSGRE